MIDRTLGQMWALLMTHKYHWNSIAADLERRPANP